MKNIGAAVGDRKHWLRVRIRELVEPYPRLKRSLIALYHFYIFDVSAAVRSIITHGIWRQRRDEQLAEFQSRPSILSFDVGIDNVQSAHALCHWLIEHKVKYAEGTWTVYIRPQADLEGYFRFFGTIYPPNCGLKILKDFQAPREAVYTSQEAKSSPGAGPVRRRTPGAVEFVRIGNYLCAHELGPRVWDVIELRASGRCLTAYIVDHVEGEEPGPNQYDEFMKRLSEVLRHGELTTPQGHITVARDFEKPNCNGNLISKKEGRCLYVDFQSFRFLDESRYMRRLIEEERQSLHFGGTRMCHSGKPYLYQSIPGCAYGKRDVVVRWREYQRLLEAAELSLNGRIVFDVGCSSGLMLYKALAEGAIWGVGWDLPSVVKSARRFLLALGATRFTLIPEAVSPGTDFGATVPQHLKGFTDGILFYLAVSKHLGFPEALAKLPWQYMLYEGHAGQSISEERQRLLSISWLEGCEIMASHSFTDGDSPRRPVMIVRR